MTPEEKKLLLIDLCPRLPYGVKINVPHHYGDEDAITTLDAFWLHDIQHGRKEIKPYLRPMSSMTEEEKEFVYNGHIEFWVREDFCNKHYLDYRGLIEMGLALKAPYGMYNKEESKNESEIPIPKTVNEAIKTLAKILSDEDREYLLKNGAISMHDSLGRWIRNEWGLWTDSELKNELKKKGFEHPDDMSNYIIEEFIKYWNNKI